MWLWLVPVFLLAFWLGARMLNGDSIWGDEYWSVFDAGGAAFGPRTPIDIWFGVAERNPWHVPGFFIMLNGWGRLVGWEAAALRAFALLVGMLALAWTYRLGALVAGRRAGLYAALILATSSFFVHYLHELRMYTLFVLFTAYILWVYLAIMRTRGGVSGWLWAGLFAGALGMLYTHYFAALPLAVVGLMHAWSGVKLLLARRGAPSPLTSTPSPLPNALGRERLQSSSPVPREGNLGVAWRRWWGVVGVLAAAGVLFLPWFGTLIAGLNKVSRARQIHELALNIPETLEKLGFLFGNGSAWVALMVVALAALALRRRSRGVRDAWLLALLLLATILTVNTVTQMMREGRVRYLISLWPLLALVGAVGVISLERLAGRVRFLGGLALAAWVVFGVAGSITGVTTTDVDGSTEIYPYPMFRVADGLRAHAQPEDVIVNYLADGVPAWRYGGITDYYFRTLGLDFRTIERRYDPGEQEELHGQIMQTLLDDNRVWLAYQSTEVMTGLPHFEETLGAEYAMCRPPYTLPESISLALYARSPVCCWDNAPTDPLIRYDNGVLLTGLDALPAEAAQGETIPLLAGWSVAPDVPQHTFSVAWHLMDANGNLAAQADYGLPGQAFKCQPATLALTDVPPGEYTLRLAVYAWESGSRLSGIYTATGERGDHLTVATLRVTE